MPIYRYRNLKTNETFELEQRITESALTAHPETGDPVKRLIQPVGIAFKGSGFYVTDSRSSSGAAKSGKDKEGSSQADAKPGEGKAGAKPDSKADSKPEKKPEKAAAS